MKLDSRTFKALIVVGWFMPFAGVAQTEPLSLKHGVYVQEHEPCKGAPNAAIIVWNGVGFSGAHSTRCTSRVLRPDGTRFQVRTTCSALGDGSPNRDDANQVDSFVLDRLSSTRFVMLREQESQRSFRWCSFKSIE